tara:strand:+ start:33 stop:734 length:702 start_codon:yes stop_codon:yes gene_type:complete
MDDLVIKVAAIESRLCAVTSAAQRDRKDVLLLAVSKTRSAESIRLVAETGIKSFGENYLQEALEKIASLQPLDLDWHFIGPIQSNKTRQISENFAWVHSVDRVKIAQRLNDQRPSHLAPLNICIQINIDDEATKSGFSAEQALPAALEIMALPNLNLRGLMAIPAARQNTEAQRLPFAQLRLLLKDINRSLDNSEKLDTLSMGMSADLEAAILEQATIVRVGTDIFGLRSTKQ